MTETKSLNIKIAITILVFIIASFFIFFNLGHYGLWDDEADTALFANSVWRNGDSFAMLDQNLIAHTNGKELKGLYNRYIPPLGFYIAAPFVGLNLGSAFSARLPFALLGFLTVALLLFWLWKSNASISIWLLFTTGLLGNVSLMLYFRQCRYYSPAILTTTLIAFLYYFRNDRKRTYFALSLILILLLASNYLNFLAVIACLVVDYFIWGRKKKPVKISQSLIIFLPQLIIGGFLVSLYSLSSKSSVLDYPFRFWLQDRAEMLFWSLRDMNNCEMGVGLLIIAAPLIFIFNKDTRLIRCPTAILIFILTVVLFSPMPLYGYTRSNIRYLAPLIPLCIFTTALVIEKLSFNKYSIATILAVLAYGTNILHFGPLINNHEQTWWGENVPHKSVRSTVLDFTKELISPNKSAYRETSNWINQNINNQESIWVTPSYATYPLMFHAPKAQYAWQLNERSEQFANLPDIHFFGKIAPDYVIAFGPYMEIAREQLNILKTRGIHYLQIKELDIYWYDLIRPELFLHSFENIKYHSNGQNTIFIFKQLKKSK
ncbi:MAG: hypothetical protein KKD07_08910 [Candidatus Omnitrophica bacterium]|nr:hypothetical protein [Candidatus Omnitrophota bacterium]MBU4334546.1 hypothetical protein [Candidatus Omnitrophota bacterium]